MIRPKSVRALVTLAVLAFCSGFTPRAEAESFTLFNTGVDASGVPLPLGSNDPHWSIVDGPGISGPIPAVVVDYPLYAHSPDSNWIWRDARQGGVGPFTFRLEFDLTGFDASTAAISGAWGVDNVGDIFLNGAPAVGMGELSLTNLTEASLAQFYAFTITGGFLAGINTLDFVASGDGFDALNVNSLSGTARLSAVPEPSTLVGLGLGLSILAVASRRRLAC